MKGPDIAVSGLQLQWHPGARVRRGDEAAHRASDGGYSLRAAVSQCRSATRFQWDREIEPRLERGYVRRGADDVFIDLEELLRIVYHPKTRPEIQHAFCSHLANCLGSEDVPVAAGPGPNFLDAMVAQQAKDSPSEFLTALQEVAGESLELTHRLREVFGSRETTVEAPRCKRQRVEEFWDKVFELFGKDLPQAIRGVAEAFHAAPGTLLEVFLDRMSRASRQAFYDQQSEAQGPYYQIFDGEVKRYLSDAAYDRLRKLWGCIQVRLEGAPEVLGLPKRRAAQQSRENLTTPPAMDRLTFQFAPGDAATPGAIGIHVDACRGVQIDQTMDATALT